MKDVIVFGNGRSLFEFDFKSVPRNRYDIIGCGLAFRYWERIDWYPDVYINVDVVVCEKNKSVMSFIKKQKCSKYIVSETIKNIWPDYPKDGSILFFEDLKKDESTIYNDIVVWGSGNIAVYYALDNYNHVSMAGFDCDYTEIIPECDKQEDGTLIIKNTPKFNPNYFFDTYQQKGDIYNVPNGKKVHLNSWVELSNSIPEGKKLINYNDKTTLYHLFESYPTNSLTFQYPEYNPKNKIAFCVPSTSNGRNWEYLQSTYLYMVLLESLRPLQKQYRITVYIGYDDDDKLYSNVKLPTKFSNMDLVWEPFHDCKGDPCRIWTQLAIKAITDGHEYMQIGGDDIMYDKRCEWLPKFIKTLKSKNNIGYVAGYSNNDNIPTQFLIHKTHLEIFGWVYPPQIRNWFCDDWMYNVYGREFGNWLKQYNHYNVGGQPRYQPDNAKRLCEMLVKRHRPVIKDIKKQIDDSMIYFNPNNLTVIE